jgi:RNA polymerase sigma factor (sigma-70 family)
VRREGEERIEDDWVGAVERFQAGDPAAFDLIYARYHDRIYARVRRLIADPHEAEDVTQEVFVAAFKALPTFRPSGGGLPAWLLATARNSALAHRRRRWTAATEADQLVRLIDAITARELPEPGPKDEVDVWPLIERLPPLQREVLELRFRHDLSPGEIASRLGRSVGAVDQAQRRALATLRERLERRLGRGQGGRESADP